MIELHVSLQRQELEVRDGPDSIQRFPISTSKFGIGYEEGSFKTPLGRFRICEKIGDGEPPYTIFRGRVPDGRWDPGTETDDDLVLTRILRLDGLEADNANTYDRFIYIHATNQEDRIGNPASHGCVRMRTNDILELFDMTPLNCILIISES